MQRSTWFVILLSSPISLSVATTCTVCKDGSPVPFPDKALQVDGIPVETCGDLEITAGYLPTDNDFCGTVHSIGTICGCAIEEGACNLCRNGSKAPNATLQLDFMASDFLFGAPAGVAMTCETMEAVLHNRREGDAQCLSMRRQIGHECGCVDSDDGENRESFETFHPSSSLAPSRTPTQPCQLCALGDSIKYPDKPLDLGDLPIETCFDLNNFAGLLVEGSSDCSGIKALGFLCGCEAPPGSCTMCPNGEPLPFPQRRLSWFTDYLDAVPDAFKSIGDSFTCEMFESTLKVPSDEQLGVEAGYACVVGHLKSETCGCSAGWKTKALTWSSRVSGVASLIGSLAIISHILSLGKAQRASTYHQMVVGISVFDIFSSLAYALVGVMAPVDGGYHGSYGNDTTCKLNGFMIQLGQTSMFYNLALTLYFVMMICFNWKERRFVQIQKLVHATIVLLGVGLACASWRYLGPHFGNCHLLRPPAVESFLPLTFFYTAPVSVVLALLTFGNFLICYRVYRQQLISRQWSSSQNMCLSRRVFWQSFWYMLAFYTTVPVLLMSYYYPTTSSGSFITRNLLSAILAPSQGTWNAIVYFQRSTSFGEVVFRRARRLSQRVSTNTRFSNQSQGDKRTGMIFASRNPSSRLLPKDSHQQQESSDGTTSIEFSLDRLRNIMPSHTSQTSSPRLTKLASRNTDLERSSSKCDEPTQCIHDADVDVEGSASEEVGDDDFDAASDYWGLNFSREGLGEESSEVGPNHHPPRQLQRCLSLQGNRLLQLQLDQTMEDNNTGGKGSNEVPPR